MRLEGPPPVFDGVTYAYGGRSEIELVVPSPLTGVALGGNGRVLSLDGLYEKGSSGLRVIAR